ncbi:MAG: hypothetical protein M1817_003898 [Caeruleum heppii]|nr:MAG: hypothetical protein M1817_003898 [Caeruleum heppii]
MAPSRARSNVKRNERQSSVLKPLNDQVRLSGIERKRSLTPIRKSARLKERLRLHRQLESQEQAPPDSSASVRSSDPNRKRKRSQESGSNHKTEAGEVERPFSPAELKPGRKRPRISPANWIAQDTLGQEAANNHLSHWIREGHWPKEFFEHDGDMTLTRKRSTPSLSKRESDISGVSLREGKNPAVRNRRYEQILVSVGIYMDRGDEEAITDASKILCKTLLDTNQIVPQDTVFNDDLFERVCEKVRNRNEARVIRDLSSLLVPSAELLYVRGAINLKHLIENVDEGWIKSIPLVNGPRPQPDFSVGLKATAFTRDQLKKLDPHVGDWQTTSRLVATDEMYFPFLTSEVKCGNEALNIADRQNAHSASVAVNAIVELYRAISRQDELHRQILAFSVSHDNRVVRIYGHYALIDGKDTSFYRHLIKSFDIVSDDGKDKWLTYKFTRNVYDTFVPLHLKRICAAVDQLPDPEAFLVEPLSQQSNAESVEQGDSQSAPSYSQESASRLPSSQTTEPVFKKPKGKGTRK